MESSLVSIAMATYNGERFLEKQMASILDQTYKNIEVVVCDDVSTDDTVAILKAFAKKDKRVRLVENKKNLGYVKNFEKTISLCKGEYIALSDQDDIWMEDKIAILIQEIGEASLIHSDAYLIDEEGNIFSQSYSQYEKKYLYPKNIIELIFNPVVTGCSALFTQELGQSILPFCKDIYVHDLWISMIAYKMQGIKYCDKPLIQYRQHKNNQIGLSDGFVHRYDRCYETKLFFKKQKSKFVCLFSDRVRLDKDEYRLAQKMQKFFFYFEQANLLGFIYFFQAMQVVDKKSNFFQKSQKFLKYFIKSFFCKKRENASL